MKILFKDKKTIQIFTQYFQDFFKNLSILYRGNVPLIIINHTHNKNTFNKNTNVIYNYALIVNHTTILINKAVNTKDSIITKATILFENNISFSIGFLEAPNKNDPNTIPVAKAAKEIGNIRKENTKTFAAITKNI